MFQGVFGVNMDLCGERLRHEELSSSAQAIIKEIQEHHKQNKMQKLQSKWEECRDIKQALRQKYVDLIELVREVKPECATHFRLSRKGDVVFINNNQLYGQTFKRLWSLHLPLC